MRCGTSGFLTNDPHRPFNTFFMKLAVCYESYLTRIALRIIGFKWLHASHAPNQGILSGGRHDSTSEPLQRLDPQVHGDLFFLDHSIVTR